MSRGERLCGGGLSVLYHQTDMKACKNILKKGFDVGRSTPGNQGMGMYFADTASVTGYKTRHTGCVIKALVRLGNVFDMGNHWLPGVHRLNDGCDPLFGYTLANEHFDSVTTIKHGRERAIFFMDQVIDMIAYPTGNYYRNHGEVRGAYINGRSEFNYPSSCNPNDFPEYQPPPCNFSESRALDKACASGFSNVGCFTKPDGNVVADERCTGGQFLKKEKLDWAACQKNCYDAPNCKGFEYNKWAHTCKQFSTVPRSYRAGGGFSCMKKKTRIAASATAASS